jgi:hypothetical protein
MPQPAAIAVEWFSNVFLSVLDLATLTAFAMLQLTQRVQRLSISSAPQGGMYWPGGHQPAQGGRSLLCPQ